MRGTLTVPFTELVRDTIAAHGIGWALRYYCHGPSNRERISHREFRIFAGI